LEFERKCEQKLALLFADSRDPNASCSITINGIHRNMDVAHYVGILNDHAARDAATLKWGASRGDMLH
jgi:hypothetical protein